ncbi:acyl carrier protein [Vibrio splendidus]
MLHTIPYNPENHLNNITERVRRALHDGLDIPLETLTDDAHFENDIKMDSLDLAEARMYLEDEFDLFADEAIDERILDLKTIKTCSQYLFEYETSKIQKTSHP